MQLKNKKVIFVITSCKAHRETRQKAVRETWAKLIPDNVEWFFVEGAKKEHYDEKEKRLFVECEDTYQDLAKKTHQLAKYLSKNKKFDYVFKIDDDTLFLPNEWLEDTIPKCDYYGVIVNNSRRKEKRRITWASGGCYMLSKKAVDTLATYDFQKGIGNPWWYGERVPLKKEKYEKIIPESSTEDMMVGDILKQNGIDLTACNGRHRNVYVKSRKEKTDILLSKKAHSIHPIYSKEMYLLYNTYTTLKLKKKKTIPLKIKEKAKSILVSIKTHVPNPESPLFMYGMARSGTTLLQRILNAHSDITIWGENRDIMHHLTKIYYTLYEEQNLTLKKKPLNNLKEATAQLKNPSVWQAWTNWFGDDHIKRSCRTFIESLFNPLKKKYWGYKEVRFGDRDRKTFEFLISLYPQAKFVFLVRNPKAVIESYRRSFKMAEVQRSTKLLSEDWKEVNNCMLEFSLLYPNNTFIIEYEDLIDPQKNVLKALYKFLSIDPHGKEENILQQIEGRNWVGHKKSNYTFTKEKEELIENITQNTYDEIKKVAQSKIKRQL